MKDTGALCAVFYLLLFGSCEPRWRAVDLKVGPQPDEEGTYVYQTYTSTGVITNHCRYCPDGAFHNTSENIRTQEPFCIDKYDNIVEEIKESERENHKIPICKIGEVPGCGPPPDEKRTDGYIWSCDPGYSDEIYSVYFSCALVSEKSRVLILSYYCAESLLWELDSSISEEAISTDFETENADQKVLSTESPGETSNADQKMLSPESPSNHSFWLLFVVLGVLTILVIGVTVCLIRRRRKQSDRSIPSGDVESSVAFITSVEARSESQNGHAGITSNVRQQPYGEERPESADNHTDNASITSQTSKDGANCHPPSPGNSCQQDNDVCNKCHQSCSGNTCQYTRQNPAPVGESDDSQTPPSSLQNQPTTSCSVRGEFQSFGSNEQKCQCLLFQKPDACNPSVKGNKFAVDNNRVNQMNSLNDLDMTENTSDRSKDTSVAGISVNDRQNPLGIAAVDNYTESGYFDDENDQRHETKPKERTGSGSDVEARSCISGIENDHNSLLDKKKDNL